MRRISFTKTTDQIRKRTKFVTRRLGWLHAKPGDRLLAVDRLRVKNAEVLAVIEIVSVRRERLWKIYATDFPDGVTPALRPVHEQVHETTREGFGNFTGVEFAEFFQRMHGMDHDDFDVTRIEFRYLGNPECEYCSGRGLRAGLLEPCPCVFAQREASVA